MAMKNTFQRYEIKYLVSTAQKELIKSGLSGYIQTNEFSFSTIRNIYYDTENFHLVRSSLEKPLYKEKLRVRSYRDICPGDPVFVEIKKKYDHIVYKRRLEMPEHDMEDWLMGDARKQPDSQIGKEIAYFCDYYHGLRPAVYLSYDREAYQGVIDPEFRVTFDTNIMARTDHLSLLEAPFGEYVIPKDQCIMEIKVAGAYPLWLSKIITELHLQKTSFSKYGTVYQNMILPELGGHIRSFLRSA